VAIHRPEQSQPAVAFMDKAPLTAATRLKLYRTNDDRVFRLKA
jgi:hypothetical protein